MTDWKAVVDERKPSGERHIWNSTVSADDALSALRRALYGYDPDHVQSVEVERVRADQ